MMFCKEKVGTSSLHWHLPISIGDLDQTRSDARPSPDQVKMFSLIDHSIYILRFQATSNRELCGIVFSEIYDFISFR